MPLFLRSLYPEVTVNQFRLDLDIKVEDFNGEKTFVDNTGFNRKKIDGGSWGDLGRIDGAAGQQRCATLLLANHR